MSFTAAAGNNVARQGSEYSPPDRLRPTSKGLTTVPYDVQYCLMGFLSTRDLSVLMRTCRDLLDICLLPLCARSNDFRYYDDRKPRLPSFRDFLRIHAGASSRAHLITDLNIKAGCTEWDKYKYEFRSIRLEWSKALREILGHCTNLRRLRIRDWFYEDISFVYFSKIIGSSLRRFEELTVRMPSEADATEALGQFARLPLRKLFFFEPSSKDVPHISLQVLPRSGLTELEICGCPPASEKPFPMVQKLGIIADMAETFVFDVTATFPNLVHLILRGHRWMYNIDYLQTRTRNEEIWQLQCPKAWQSVSTIWAEDSCCLYALGFPRRLSSLSLPLSLDILDREDNLNVAPVVVSASPRFLELRVFMLPFMDVNNDSFEYCPGNWKLNLGPSIQCMTLLLEDRDAISTREKVIIEMLEGLGRMLPGLPSLTHLLVRFVPNLQPPGRGAVDTDWTYPSSSVHAKNIHETIEKHLHILAIMGTSLRWIGYEVQEWGIQSWNISRSELISVEAVRQLQHTGMNPMSESEIRAVLERKGMNPMSEWATRAVLRKEGMNEFRDVPVLHDW